MRKIVLFISIGCFVGLLVGLLRTREGAAKRRQSPAASFQPRAAAAQATPSVPQLESARPPAPPSIVNDPTLKSYDAVKLAEATGVPLVTVFAREPRHPVFGPDMEKRLQHYFNQDLHSTGVKARLLSADCRTRICVTTFEADDPEQLRQLILLLGYTPIANVFQPGAETAPNTREFIFAWEGEEKDAAMWILAYPRSREARLLEMRQKVKELGAHPAGYPPVPADVEPLR
jgi:hypothetical protein